MTKNFEFLNGLIHGGADRIVLEEDIVLDSHESDKYLEGIPIDMPSISIDGNGHHIDAGGKTRIFINLAGNVTLRNIVLLNGSSDYGGAILNKGTLTIMDCEIRDNQADTGGAIQNYYKKEMTIINTKLNSNRAKYDGGAVFNSNGGQITIKNCDLLDNAADIGGAISNNNGKIIVNSSKFENNGVQYNGGAISNNAEGTVGIVDSRFENNSCKKDGGAISNGGTMTIENTSLESNEADELGGSVYNIGKIEFAGAVFKDNKSTCGGAIFTDSDSVKISDCEFDNNRASYRHDSFNVDIEKIDMDNSKFRSDGSSDDSNMNRFYSKNKSVIDFLIREIKMMLIGILFVVLIGFITKNEAYVGLSTWVGLTIAAWPIIWNRFGDNLPFSKRIFSHLIVFFIIAAIFYVVTFAALNLLFGFQPTDLIIRNTVMGVILWAVLIAIMIKLDNI